MTSIEGGKEKKGKTRTREKERKRAFQLTKMGVGLGLDAPLGAIDRAKLNVKGSSLAAGHPFAATGGRIIATAAKILEENGGGRVLVSICAAGGQGITAIIER